MALVVAAAAAGVAGGRMMGTSAPASLTFTMRTFEPQSIFSARYMPDGETIVFSSALTGNSPALFEIRQGTLEARRFGPAQTHLLSVSSKGELAVLTGATYLNHRLFVGTLARMTLEGSPRPWLDRVREADWSPDGTTVAVIRDLGGKDQLETRWAPGCTAPTATQRSTGLARRDARGVHGAPAAIRRPRLCQGRGPIGQGHHARRRVLGRRGRRLGARRVGGVVRRQRARDGRPAGGRDVVSDLSRPCRRRQPCGVCAHQPWRFHNPRHCPERPVAGDARGKPIRRRRARGRSGRRAGPELAQQELGARALGHGLRLLFSDGNGGADYAVVWRKVDGSPIVHLGDGDNRGWSPDGRWVLGLIASRSQLVVTRSAPEILCRSRSVP